MARTTPDEVREIYDTDKTDEQIEVWINIASEIVTDNLSDCGYTDAQLEEIERQLTAHLMTDTYTPTKKSEKLGEASVTYAASFGSGLTSTSYGKTLRILDTCGVLGSLGKSRIKLRAITSFK